MELEMEDLQAQLEEVSKSKQDVRDCFFAWPMRWLVLNEFNFKKMRVVLEAKFLLTCFLKCICSVWTKLENKIVAFFFSMPDDSFSGKGTSNAVSVSEQLVQYR